MTAATPSTAPATSFRLLGRDVAIYGGADVLLRGTAFITIPIYTHLLSPSAYGVLGFAATVTSLLSVFLVLGCDAAYARYQRLRAR